MPACRTISSTWAPTSRLPAPTIRSKPSCASPPRKPTWLERQIDHANDSLTPLTSFVLPGGSPLAASLHVARTVVRRAERLAVELMEREPDVNREAVIYLNRLSDLLFVLARLANSNGETDVLWQPGQNTKTSKNGG